MKEFVYKGDKINIRTAMQNNIAGMGRGLALQLLKQREVKVNGSRANASTLVCEGDVVRVYFDESLLSPRIVYLDSNIMVVDKRVGMETSDGEGCLLLLLRELYGEVYAVHRLDANTRGLVMFALNAEAERSLSRAIKNRSIVKRYHALVVGTPKERSQTLESYLVKNASAARVSVFDNEVAGSRRIITKYRVAEDRGCHSLLEVELVTGATHQIRAHLAHAGYPIVGDDLYGNRAANRAAKKRYQELVAFSITLNGLDGELAYLNGREFVI